MSIETAILIAIQNLGGAMESSARLCISDAIRLNQAGDFKNAYNRVLESLKYSVGIFHEDYQEVLANQ